VFQIQVLKLFFRQIFYIILLGQGFLAPHGEYCRKFFLVMIKVARSYN